MSVSLLWRLMLPTVMRLLEYRVSWFFQSLLYVAAPMVSLLVWLAVADQGVRLPTTASSSSRTSCSSPSSPC